jgi:hypothetical protein
LYSVDKGAKLSEADEQPDPVTPEVPRDAVTPAPEPEPVTELPPSRDGPKTPAERARDYRERKKAAKESPVALESNVPPEAVAFEAEAPAQPTKVGEGSARG